MIWSLKEEERGRRVGQREKTQEPKPWAKKTVALQLPTTWISKETEFYQQPERTEESNLPWIL